jgi:hypothetical protein
MLNYVILSYITLHNISYIYIYISNRIVSCHVMSYIIHTVMSGLHEPVFFGKICNFFILYDTDWFVNIESYGVMTAQLTQESASTTTLG